MQKTYYLPKRLSNSEQSYLYLCELNEMLKQHQQTKIRLSLKSTSFIQPNVIAVLGFLIESAKLNENSIILCDLQPQIKTLFENYQFIGKRCKNKEHYIPYKTFKHTDSHAFNLYIRTSLTYIKNQKLRILIENRLTELFRNSVNHGVISSNTPLGYLQAAEGELGYNTTVDHNKSDHFKDIFICGYINLSQDWLFVTIVNRGMTFYENIVSVQPNFKNHERYECLKWAMECGTSTKGRLGVGLTVITKELYFSGGNCYCISGDAYYELKKKKGQTLPFNLNGSIMTLSFNLKRLIAFDFKE